MKAQITLILLALVGGSVYAAQGEETPMPMSNDINVTAPHQSGSWSFGAEALWLQPINQAFTYADLRTVERQVSTPPRQVDTEDNYQEVDPGYHGWFGADITYAFPGNGRDVTLGYEGFRGNDVDHISSPIIETFTKVITLLAISDFNAYDTAKGETQINYDAADLVFGQKLEVGERIGLHPFVGLRYATINVKNRGNYTGPYGDTMTQVEQAVWNSGFNGIGPRFGSDAEINLGWGFSVHARLGLSALIGSTNPDFNSIIQIYDNDSGAVVTTDTNTDGHGSSHHLIPEMDGRLGLNYSYNFDSNMALGVEAGWQATNYFNATNQFTGYDEVGNKNVANSNFGLQGPYARVQLDIA